MTSAHTRRSGLFDAYRATLYRVTGATPAFDLRVDRKSDPLAELFRARGAHQAAFLTACNPMSQLMDAERNRAALALLLDRVGKLGLAWLEGIGLDPKGLWPGEESLLVLGIEFDGACALARQFEQAAFLFAGPDAIPRLVVAD